MKIPSPTFLIQSFLGVMRRFPFVMIAAAAGVFAAMTLIHHMSGGPDQAYFRILLTAALGLPLFLSAQIVVEKWKLSRFWQWVPPLVVAVLLAGFYMMLSQDGILDDEGIIIRFMGLNLVAHLMVAFLPWLDNTPVAGFWEYNKRLFGTFVMGALYSLVIYAGLSVAILAIDNLFNVDINEEIYGQLFVFIAGIFNTSFFLANYPAQFSDMAEAGNSYDVVIKNLTKFILIPIVCIYFLILYAYSVKILVEWELPKGWVSSLVLGFSVAGVFTYLLNYLLPKLDDSVVVSTYRRWFFYVLLPMVVLLFVGIGRRIGDYGITEERYFVATAGVWLLLLSLYFIFSKKDNIKFIPISLAVFALLSVVGPFNAFRVSGNSQLKRLTTMLEKHGMLKDGIIVAAKDTLPQAGVDSIRSVFSFMRTRGHFQRLQPLMANPPSSLYPSQEDMDLLLSGLGLSPSHGKSGFCSFNFPGMENIKIAGFDRFWKISPFTDMRTYGNYTGWKISKDGTGLEFVENGAPGDYFNLQPYLRSLEEKYSCNPDGPVDSGDAVFEAKGEKLAVRIVFENIYLAQKEKLELQNLSGLVFLKEE
ncbi:MAG: DUF4153 domain-containing protein [Saprospiraceae bacterium]|nr:MAG: DUF4153 domain-containing protein [Saprospiraceae bacterium]